MRATGKIRLIADHKDAQGLPSAGTIDSELEGLAEGASAGDRILFFFSGHGVRIGDEFYIVPQDGRSDKTKYLISFSNVLEILNKSDAKQKVIVLDACHSGPTVTTLKGPLAEASDKFLAEYLVKTKGIAIVSSSTEDQASTTISPDPKVSLFTYFLLKALRGEPQAMDGKLLTLDSLYQYVSLNVIKTSKSYGKTQQPTKKHSESGVMVLGDFNRPSLHAAAEEVANPLPEVALQKNASNPHFVPYAATEAKEGNARFRNPDQALGQFWNLLPFGPDPGYEVFLAKGPAFWLRVMPREASSHEWEHDELLKCGRGPTVALQPLLWSNLQYLRAEDGIGAYEAINNLKTETETTSVAFAFNTGEIWAVDTTVLQISGQKQLNFLDIARVLVQRLRSYGDLLRCIGIKQPFNGAAGSDGVKGWRLAAPPPPEHVNLFPGETCLSNEVKASGTYDLDQTSAMVLRPFFHQLFKKCSTKIPEHIEEAIRNNRRF